MPEPTLHRRRWWILAVLIISLFTVNLDNTILNVALPTLSRSLGAGTSELQWMVDAYVLLYAGLLIAAGALGDRFGRRRVLVAGLVLFGCGSLASAFAPSATALILLRGVMGIGGALITPSTLSVTAHVFSLEERPKAIGIWTGFAGLGIVAGPLLAGWLLEHYAWGSVFLINVPVVVVSLAGILAIVPETRSPDARLDLVGTALSVAGLVALVYGVIEAPALGWLSPLELAVFGLAASLLAGFVGWELRSDSPMFDVRLFGSVHFAAACLAVALTSFGMFGSLFFFSQYLQAVLGFSTMQAGVAVFPVAIALAVCSPLGPVVARAVGTRTTVGVGLGAVAAGLLAMRAAGTVDGYPFVAASLALLGGGMGLAGSPVAMIMFRALPRSKSGVASAINSTARELGGAFGVAILGSISAPVYAAEVRPALGLLPPPAAAAVHDSLNGAVAVAASLPGPQAAAFLALARQAFVDGMAQAVLVGAVVALLGAAVAFFFLPARGSTQASRTLELAVAAPAEAA